MKVNHKIFQTSNGMNVLLLKRPERYTAAFSLLVNAGSIFENRGVSGISHFFEHLFFTGTKTYPTEELLRNRHQELGLSISASTNYDSITVSGTFRVNELKDALMVIEEMVFGTLITPKMIDKERGILLEEERLRRDNNYTCLWNKAFEVRFKKGNPLQLPREGTGESIKSLRANMIQDFYRKHCVPSNSTLIIASNKSYKELKSVLENISQRFLKGNKLKKPTLSNDGMTNFSASVKKNRSQQVYAVISFPSYGGVDLRIVWRHMFLMELLYEKLNKALRQDKGLLYDLSSSVIKITKNVAFSYIVVACDPDNFGQVIDLIFKQIREIKAGKIDMVTLNRIRGTGNKTLPMGFDSITGTMSWVTDSFYEYKKVYSPEDVIVARNKVTKEDLKKAAKNVFNYSKMNFVTLGPIERNYLERLVGNINI